MEEGRSIVGDPLPSFLSPLGNMRRIDGGVYDIDILQYTAPTDPSVSGPWKKWSTVRLEVDTFYISETEVSCEQFSRVQGDISHLSSREKWRVINRCRGKRGQPVVNVTWQQVADWLSSQTGDASGYRLPTAAEWLVAARGGNKRPMYTRIPSREICEYVNGAAKDDPVAPFANRSCSDGYHKSWGIESGKPNEYGLKNMYGNVSELVSGCWKGFPVELTRGVNREFLTRGMKGDADCNLKMYLGGSSASRINGRNLSDPLGYDALDDAYVIKPDESDKFVGFRVVRSFKDDAQALNEVRQRELDRQRREELRQAESRQKRQSERLREEKQKREREKESRREAIRQTERRHPTVEVDPPEKTATQNEYGLDEEEVRKKYLTAKWCEDRCITGGMFRNFSRYANPTVRCFQSCMRDPYGPLN